MLKIFSWDGLDRALSDRAQSLFIVAAALANLIFLNSYIKAALQDFLSDFNKGPGCESLMDSAEVKLLSLYLSTFFLGVCALIVKALMPQEIKEFSDKDDYVDKFKDCDKKEIFAHFGRHVGQRSFASSETKRSIISMVDSAQQLDGMSRQDVSNYARQYFSQYYDYKKSSFILAPVAKLFLSLSILIFGIQAVRTFLAVACVEMKSFGLLP